VAGEAALSPRVPGAAAAADDAPARGLGQGLRRRRRPTPERRPRRSPARRPPSRSRRHRRSRRRRPEEAGAAAPPPSGASGKLREEGLGNGDWPIGERRAGDLGGEMARFWNSREGGEGKRRRRWAHIGRAVGPAGYGD